MKQLVSVKLINFQSWVDKSGDMNFTPDVLNVIKGRNETGKSVLFKVIYEMCFNGYHDIKCLIRRGFDQALAYFEYSDGNTVLFHVFRNGGRVYYLQGPDDEQPRQWQQNDIPDEIVDAMGLIISRENQIILNVLDKDVPMPFVKTDPKYNASVLKSILEPEELTRYFERSKEYVKRIQDAIAYNSQRANFWNTKQSALSFVDVNQLKVDQILLDSRTRALESCIKVYNRSADIVNLDESKPVFKEYPLASIGQQLDVLQRLLSVMTSLTFMQSVFVEQPAPPRYTNTDMDMFNSMLECTYQLLEINHDTQVISQLEEPEQIVIPKELDQNFKLADSLLNLQRDIVAITAIEEPVVPNIPEGLHEEFETLRIAHEVFYNLSLVFDRTQKLNACTNIYNKVCNDLARMESVMTICPTCGRPFHE